MDALIEHIIFFFQRHLQFLPSAWSRRVLVRSKHPNTYPETSKGEKSLLFFINSVSKLTSAERDLIRLLLDGKKVREIADIRCVEVVTVKTQIKGLLRKFGCARTKGIVELIRELNVAHLF